MAAAKVGTRLPEGWAPDEAGVEFARRAGLALDPTLAAFRAHFTSAVGAAGVRADWSAVWRRWCRDSVRAALEPWYRAGA
jgi:hypothetical protein